MPTEIELKLRLPQTSVARLQRHPLLRALSVSAATSQKLYSVYYDTPELDLRRHAVALRLRRVGRRWVQTLKGGGSVAAGLHQRDEWESSLQQARLDFSLITDHALARLFADRRLQQRLRPVFITEFSRSSRTLRCADGSEVAFCLDRGQIIAGDAREPLCEIELELMTGDPMQLFQLALALLQDLPVRLENRSKAERGYALYCGSEAPPLKAALPALAADVSTCDAFIAICWNCLGHMHGNESGLLAGHDPEYLHQLRVALRRLRSALGIFGRALPGNANAPIARQLKWLNSRLGSAREWDVFVTETLVPVAGVFPDHAGLAALRRNCDGLQRRHQAAAQHAIASAQYAQLMLQLGIWLNTRPRHDQSRPAGPKEGVGEAGPSLLAFAATLLARRHKRLKKQGRRLAALSVAELHALRILAKKQRYATEFFVALFPYKRTRRYIAALSALQDVLGALNDTVSVRQLLDEAAIAKRDADQREAAGIVLGWSAERMQRSRAQLEQTWSQFNRCKPFW